MDKDFISNENLVIETEEKKETVAAEYAKKLKEMAENEQLAKVNEKPTRCDLVGFSLTFGQGGLYLRLVAMYQDKFSVIWTKF